MFADLCPNGEKIMTSLPGIKFPKPHTFTMPTAQLYLLHLTENSTLENYHFDIAFQKINIGIYSSHQNICSGIFKIKFQCSVWKLQKNARFCCNIEQKMSTVRKILTDSTSNILKMICFRIK